MADHADFAGEIIEETTVRNVSSIRAELDGDGQDYCEECGDDLSVERREAAPWAIRCVPCAGVFERKQALRR